MKKKPYIEPHFLHFFFQKDRDSERLYKWQHCFLTQEPLGKHIVVCQLGRVYNKEAVIERLLDKTQLMPRSAQHIKSIKDIKELNLTPNPSFSRGNSSMGDGGAYTDRQVAPWICPITGLEMSGKFKFVVDWSNGKVLSERAHKMVKDDATRILEEDLVILNPEAGEDADLMRTKMEGRKAREKAAKKAKKELKRAQEKESPESVESNSSNGVAVSKKMKKVAKEDEEEQKKNEKKKKLSVQDDRTKSEAYKSLFSTHKTALNQPKGNWVTFDPRYN